MKIQNKLFMLALAIIELSNSIETTAQTNNYVPKWSTATTAYINTATPIYENGINIGIGTTSPSSKLTVANGDVRVSNTSNGYMLGNTSTTPVLWNYGIPSNIYVGTNVGNYTSVTGNNDNTFVGNNIGNYINQGHCNVVLGSMGSTIPVGGSTASNALTDGNWNVFIGYEAGHATVDGVDNTFVGHGAGFNNIGSG